MQVTIRALLLHLEVMVLNSLSRPSHIFPCLPETRSTNSDAAANPSMCEVLVQHCAGVSSTIYLRTREGWPKLSMTSCVCHHC